MAISLRGSAENSKEMAAGADTLTVTHPVGIAENDVVYISHGFGSDGLDGDVNMTMSTSGYTELADLFADDVSDAESGYYRKRMTSTPDSTAVCAATTSFGGYGWCAVELVLIGVDTTTSEDATTTTATGIDSAVPNSPSITTVTANAWVLSAGGGTVTDTSVTAPTGYTNQIDRNHDATFGDFTIGMASIEVATPAAENPAAWTTWTTDANQSWNAVSIAVRPAAGGAATEPANVNAPRTLALMNYGR